MYASIPVYPGDPPFDASNGAYEESKKVVPSEFPKSIGRPGSKSPSAQHFHMFSAASRSRLFRRDPRCKILPFGGFFDMGRDIIEFPDALPKALREWASSGCRFASVPFTIVFDGIEESHAVVVFADRILKTVDLFDPNGSYEIDFEIHGKVSDCILGFFERLSDRKDWSYRGILENTPVAPNGKPIYGPQVWDETLEGRITSRGNCVFWCLLYCLERFRNPEISGLAVATSLSLRSKATRGEIILGIKPVVWSILMKDPALRNETHGHKKLLKASNSSKFLIAKVKWDQSKKHKRVLVTVRRPPGGVNEAFVERFLHMISSKNVSTSLLNDWHPWVEFSRKDIKVMKGYFHSRDKSETKFLVKWIHRVTEAMENTKELSFG